MKKIFSEIVILVAVILLISYSLEAQQLPFKVLTLFGNVESRHPSDEVWKKVNTGEGIKDDREIRLGKNSYAALMYSDGRTMEIMNEGIFSVKELELNIRASKISVTQKFANFVTEEILTDKSNGKTMKEFAAVVRVKPNHIESAIPFFNSFLDPEINLMWHEYNSSNMYVLNILNSENTTIFMDLTEDTAYTLDAEELNLRKGFVYKWFVFDVNNPQIVSDTNSISVLPEKDRKSILDTVEILNEEISSDETPLNILALGTFYESNNLNLEAMDQFRKVIELTPECEEYRLLFAKFLLKNKLYVRASELFEEKLLEE